MLKAKESAAQKQKELKVKLRSFLCVRKSPKGQGSDSAEAEAAEREGQQRRWEEHHGRTVGVATVGVATVADHRVLR